MSRDYPVQEGLPPTLEELGLEPQAVKNPMMLNRVSSSLPLDPDALMKQVADMKSKRTLNGESTHTILYESNRMPQDGHLVGMGGLEVWRRL